VDIVNVCGSDDRPGGDDSLFLLYALCPAAEEEDLLGQLERASRRPVPQSCRIVAAIR
jgi:hypothetical protein